MSTPEIVIDTPDAAASLPDLPAHLVALLLAGLDRRIAQNQRMRDLGIRSDEGFREQHAPATRIQDALTQRLADWCTAQGHARAPGDHHLDATWPAAPLVPSPPLTAAELWQLRLAVDQASAAAIDAPTDFAGELRAHEELRADYAFFQPLRDLADAVLSGMTNSGFAPQDTY